MSFNVFLKRFLLQKEEAVDLLLRHSHYKEAFTLTRHHPELSKDVLHRVVQAWTGASSHEGNFEFSAML